MRVIIPALVLIALGSVVWFELAKRGAETALRPEPAVRAGDGAPTPADGPDAGVAALVDAALVVSTGDPAPIGCSGQTPLSLGPPLADPPVCTRRCRGAGECPASWCCFDPVGAADPVHFVCAPPATCAGRVHGTPGRGALSPPP